MGLLFNASLQSVVAGRALSDTKYDAERSMFEIEREIEKQYPLCANCRYKTIRQFVEPARLETKTTANCTAPVCEFYIQSKLDEKKAQFQFAPQTKPQPKPELQRNSDVPETSIETW